MVTLHEVITFLVSMQISISSLQTHNVNRCGRSRHLARKLSLRRKRDRKSGSAGMPRPISYAVFCLKKKKLKNCRLKSAAFGSWLIQGRARVDDDVRPRFAINLGDQRW